MQPVITIFCAFTRRWAIDRWLDNLANVEHDKSLTNLCCIIDTDEPAILVKLKKFAEKHGYRSFHYIMNTDWQPNESRVAIRRMRIADMKNQSKELVAKTDGQYIIGLEDDTVFDRLESFKQLYGPIVDDSSIGFYQGVQMGRWGVRMLGVWKVDDPIKPMRAETVLPYNNQWTGMEEVDAGGFYGYATHRDLYLQHEYFTSSSQPWGPDVNFGLWVRNQDYLCMTDWEIVYGHNDYNNIGYPDKVSLTKIVYTKDSNTGAWQRNDTDRAS
jgi:hypothetical protein